MSPVKPSCGAATFASNVEIRAAECTNWFGFSDSQRIHEGGDRRQRSAFLSQSKSPGLLEHPIEDPIRNVPHGRLVR